MTGGDMYGPAVSKFVVWLMIVLGLGTYLGLQYAFVPDPPIGKEVLSAVLFIFGLGVAWATIKGDMKIIRKEFELNNQLIRSDVEGKFKLIVAKFEALAQRTSNLEHRRKNTRHDDR